MTFTTKGRIEIACFATLLGLGLLMSKVSGCGAPAAAHPTEECVCSEEPAPVCPPEGFLLMPRHLDPTQAQQSIEEALKAIEEAQEATKKGPAE